MTKTVNDIPYSPRDVRTQLESQYPGQVTSTTVPPSNLPNVKLAGQHKAIQLKDGTTMNIVFDQRGFPIFDNITKFDTRISRDVALVQDRGTHFKNATASLQRSISDGQVSANAFNAK